MNDNLFASLDRLLLEFDTIQRINKCLESIKENKANISKICEAISKVDEDIAFYYKHSKEIKDSCSNWKPTCDVFHKHEDYIKDQLTAYQETNEKDKQMARLFESKKCTEALDEKNKNTEKTKEFEERDRIFEKDEQVSNKSSQNSQLLLPCESRNFVRLINMNSSEPRVTVVSLYSPGCPGTHSVDQAGLELRDPPASASQVLGLKYKKEESSANQSKFVRNDLRQKENDPQNLLPAYIFNDSGMDSNSKSSHVPAVKSSQGFMQFRLNQPNYNQWIEKEHTGTQVLYIEHFAKSIENNSVEEDRAENFPQTPETPSFLRTPEALKTPESVEKMQFPKSPFFEITKNAASEGQKQKNSPGFSFLMSYTSRSPGLNLFDSSVSDSEISSDQFNEHYSAINLNPPSSQQGIGKFIWEIRRRCLHIFFFIRLFSHIWSWKR
ncbi:hypothetical protein APTSU1_001275500 [Apodemus speciosus]|uniref:Uncharacterized protein n=1 Tax=Apodemus speciosus TaxID=105296 RepID=A0ABQ0FE48_APOSI